MQIVPLIATPSQTVNIILGGQNCTITVYQKSTGMFIDVTVNGSVLLTCVSCLDRNRIVRDAYLGFVGDLAFVDLQGTSDPDYTGIGDRFLLMYIEATDL